ncbi:MAG: transglutaminase [Polaromonas sp.]|nr:transglutaminase [Polaromonas sp.]
MQLRIVHQTRYHYDPPVVMAQHLAHLTPPSLPGQDVLTHTITITPEGTEPSFSVDAFGNQRCFFMLQAPHAELSVTADSLVSTAAPRPLPDSPSWEEVRENLTYRAGTTYDPAAEFTFASPFVPRHSGFADFARDLFAPDAPVLACAQALMNRIHTDLTYEGGSTAVNTPALEALAQRKGVCQDFAHIMIGCLRSLGLPARYVSGYLLTHPPEGQPRLIGADASHAWVQVHAPGVGWVDFDPTNNHCGRDRPSEEYVTLALGRDFGDVSPLRGVIQGGGNPVLKVSVTVAPPDELAALQVALPPGTHGQKT